MAVLCFESSHGPTALYERRRASALIAKISAYFQALYKGLTDGKDLLDHPLYFSVHAELFPIGPSAFISVASSVGEAIARSNNLLFLRLSRDFFS